MNMAIVIDKNRITSLLKRRVSQDGFFPSQKEVEDKLLEGKQLRFYYGIDPTGKDIHLGHTVQFFLLKELVDLGHKVIILMGDFTARIGDPTGKDKTRKPLTEEEVKENMKNYLGQIHKILPEGSFDVKHNSEWLKKMNMEKILDLTSQVTVQQMITRDMFQERIKDEKPIGLHEFLYPLMQGYDSVAMEIDGEVGGHDQIFNMLVGRDLEKKYLGKDKLVLATRLLVDEATGKKMSKSEGEIIAVSDEPSEIRRKILATDDKITKTIFELCTNENQEFIDEKSRNLNAREFKELLSDKIIEIYHGKSRVEESRRPTAISAEDSLAVTMTAAGVVTSNSEAKNLINAGAVEINGEIQKDWKYKPQKGDKIKIGKGKFIEIK